MPKESSDYSKACVYGIFQYDKNHYIGSTKNFTGRKIAHKSSCKNDKSSVYNLPLYKFIRDSGGWNSGGWEMKLIEEYPDCKSSQELFKYEREHIEFWKPDLNCVLPILTDDERKAYKIQYSQENKQKILEQMKIYRQENKEKMAERDKIYYEENKEKIAEKRKQFCHDNKQRIAGQKKLYYEDNKEKRAENAKKYYQKNKERILEQQKKQYHIDKKEQR
jgi:hypothetical protein